MEYNKTFNKYNYAHVVHCTSKFAPKEFIMCFVEMYLYMLCLPLAVQGVNRNLWNFFH